jgi:hypothetical protein
MTYITMFQLGKYGYLGNQMFQYAALIGIGTSTNSTSVVPSGSYELVETFAVKSPTIDSILSDPSTCCWTNRAERGFSYDPEMMSVVKNTNIHGYFQTEKYFAHCKDTIRAEYTFKDSAMEDQVKKSIAGFKSTAVTKMPIVGIHVRRGDYLNLQHIHPFDEKYYESAINKMYEQHGRCHYVVVSDDIQWCKSFFTYQFAKYGTFAFSMSSYATDIALLCNVDHVIMSNSSFSWWGAWLNKSETKTVIAPAKWFGASGPADWSDIYCEGWTVI